MRKLILRQIPRVVDLATYGALNSIVLQSFMIECYLQRNIRLLVVSKLTLFNDSQTCELWRFSCGDFAVDCVSDSLSAVTVNQGFSDFWRVLSIL